MLCLPALKWRVFIFVSYACSNPFRVHFVPLGTKRVDENLVWWCVATVRIMLDTRIMYISYNTKYTGFLSFGSLFIRSKCYFILSLGICESHNTGPAPVHQTQCDQCGDFPKILLYLILCLCIYRAKVRLFFVWLVCRIVFTHWKFECENSFGTHFCDISFCLFNHIWNMHASVLNSQMHFHLICLPQIIRMQDHFHSCSDE